MNMRLDGVDVLRRVLANSAVFPLSNEIDALARKVVVSRMKEKEASLGDIKAIYAALGDVNFKKIADGISDAEAKSIVAKIDKENKDAKTSGGAAQRVLLNELASGNIDPKAKAIKERAVKKTGSKVSEAGKALKGKAMSARRKTLPDAG